MSKIFLKSISVVFFAALFLTAYPIEAQRKKAVPKKRTVTTKATTTSKSAKSTTTTSKQADVETTPTPTAIPNRAVQNLLTRIETNTGIYRRELTRSLVQNNLSGTDIESSINAFVSDFENAEKALKTRVDSGTDSVADAQDVLNRADFIQNFMRENTLSPTVQSQWKILLDNLVTLANSYKVSWNINTTPIPQPNPAYSQSNRQNNQPNYQNNQPTYQNDSRRNYPDRESRNRSGSRFDSMLTGTYRLNVTQSDDVGAVLDKTLNNTNNNNQNTDFQADIMRRNLERRLTSPDMLVIEKRNDQVTIASDLSPEATFTADNVERSEVNPYGRTVRVKAAALSNVMEISYQGDRVNDFFLTFLPVDNGQLRVTRRIYLENRDQTITVTSVYDKILPTADFSTVRTNQNTGRYNRNDPNSTVNPTVDSNRGVINEFIIPNATQLTASLRSAISTQSAREGDRFTMEISAPAQYAGAIIEGYFSNTQQATGAANQAQMTFNLDKITLRDGRAYRFNGMIDAIQLSTGETVRVMNESNTTRQRQSPRSGVGALGTILGAILGGNGAQTTQIDPAVVGSGSILVPGQNNLNLQQGTQFRIISSTPATGN